MTAGIESSFQFANLQGLAGLRSAADTAEAQLAVAQQFESLFISMMLRQMRTASAIDGGLIDNERLEMHRDLYDQQLALSLSRGRGIGLAESILRTLGGDGQAVLPGAAGPSLGLRGLDGPRITPERGMAVVRNEHAAAASAVGPTATPAAIPTATLADKARPDFSADSPETFVHTLWPHAERAARELGTVPEILIAQAALETGWGQSLPRGAGDAPSFNLFGIKADAAWTGPRAMVNTLEFIDGVPEPRREPFRVYQSVGESFTDYVKLIRTRPRYREALDAGSPAAYARALQSAGYATDPDYADKLIGILERGLPGHALRGGRHQVVTFAADKPVGGAILDATGELEGS